MHKLESRPSRERAWEYVFWVDLDADTTDPATARAIDDLGPVTTMTRVLGSYPAADDADGPTWPRAAGGQPGRFRSSSRISVSSVSSAVGPGGGASLTRALATR